MEVILPDRILVMVAVRRPIARLALEVNYRDTLFPNSPGDVRNHLLNEGEQPCVSFADDVEVRHGISGACSQRAGISELVKAGLASLQRVSRGS